MSLDTATLFTVATFITGLLGVFILVVWVQERGTRALAWWGAAYLMGGSAVGLWSAPGLAPPIAQAVPNALLFVACGMIWNGARVFHGRDALPVGLFAGAVAWILAMQFPAFKESEHLRVVLSSLVIANYTFLTAFELRRERRRSVARAWFSPFVPLLHGVVFLSPIPLTLLTPSDGWFALFGLQTLLYVIGMAFIAVIMTKERVALGHKAAAMTDPLTGLFNRRAFFEAGHQLMARQARTNSPISVLVFDLDHFKSINDRFGHAVGDDALRVFAMMARNNLRASDVLGRLGGEEFAAVLPGGSAEAAMVGERLRAAFEAAAAEVSTYRIGATVSVGVASWVAPTDINLLLERADSALYRAKSNGRNRVERVDGSLPGTGSLNTEQARGVLRSAIARWNPSLIRSANRTFIRP
jgi:diguanylate cyclase (GGDEF)-like protein